MKCTIASKRKLCYDTIDIRIYGRIDCVCIRIADSIESLLNLAQNLQ